MPGFGSGLKDIALALIGVGFVALLVGNAQQTARVIDSGGRTFAGLLGVVTLQSQYANVFNSSGYY